MLICFQLQISVTAILKLSSNFKLYILNYNKKQPVRRKPRTNAKVQIYDSVAVVVLITTDLAMMVSLWLLKKETQICLFFYFIKNVQK